MNHEAIYKAATATAAALADRRQPEKSWLQAIARRLRHCDITEQRTFEAFLRGFEQPHLLRLVSQVSNEDEQDSSFPDPTGEILSLYKPPLPGETQARLAYECFLGGFLAYLQRTHCICTLRETPAHVTLFVLQGRAFGLEDAWQKYVQDAFSRRGLTENFVLLLNSVQLAGRGFGVLDVPVVSEEQKQVLAGFYLAAIQQVGRRLRWRESQIREVERTITRASLTVKERSQSEKKLKALQDKQQEEIDKYQNAFAKTLAGLLNKEEKALLRATKRKSAKAKRTPQTTEAEEGLNSEEFSASIRKERIEPMHKLLNETKGDPFRFLEKDQAVRPSVFAPIVQAAERFTERAGNQLATTVGVKFAGVALAMYRLLDSSISFTRIPTLFSSVAQTLIERSAGDASGEWCYSCGKALGRKESSYEVRRLLFSSPDQRPQSGSASLRPKACATCAAIVLTCPLKLSDKNVIVRLDPRDQTAGTADYLRNYCRMLTIGTLNTSAGRYLSLVCTDRTAKGVLASARMGQVVYTIAKLGLELPPDVFRDFRLMLVTEGSEIPLDSALLFAAAGFLRGYGQRIIVGGDLNVTLGKAVRYMQAGAFYAAEYTILADGVSFRDEISLEHHRKDLWKFLKKLGEENMTRNGEQRAKFYGDVAALTGLLYGFCAALRNKIRQDPEQAEKDIKRILGKAIEYVDDSPAFFTYTAITNKLSSEDARLYKDPRHHFLYDQVNSLLVDLGFEAREKQEDTASYLQLYFDDITKAYTHFSKPENYGGEREWKEFLYQVKLSLYSRFPECFDSNS